MLLRVGTAFNPVWQKPPALPQGAPLQLTCTAGCSHAAGVALSRLAPLHALQIALLDAAETLPEGFLDHTSPQQEHVMDTSIYELHVRDFR